VPVYLGASEIARDMGQEIYTLFTNCPLNKAGDVLRSVGVVMRAQSRGRLEAVPARDS
jgi:hypothetical protein